MKVELMKKIILFIAAFCMFGSIGLYAMMGKGAPAARRFATQATRQAGQRTPMIKLGPELRQARITAKGPVAPTRGFVLGETGPLITPKRPAPRLLNAPPQRWYQGLGERFKRTAAQPRVYAGATALGLGGSAYGYSKLPEEYKATLSNKLKEIGKLPTPITPYTVIEEEDDFQDALPTITEEPIAVVEEDEFQDILPPDPAVVETLEEILSGVDAAEQAEEDQRVLAGAENILSVLDAVENYQPEVIRPDEKALLSEVIADSLGAEQTTQRSPLGWMYRATGWKTPVESMHKLHEEMFLQEANSLEEMNEALTERIPALDEQLSQLYIDGKLSSESLHDARASLRGLSQNLSTQAKELAHAAKSSKYKQSVPEGRVENIVELRNEYKNLYKEFLDLHKVENLDVLINNTNNEFSEIDQTNKDTLKTMLEHFAQKSQEKIPALDKTIEKPSMFTTAYWKAPREVSLKKLQKMRGHHEVARRGLAQLAEETKSPAEAYSSI